MKIGIDARLYGIKDRGIGRYTEKLIYYLEKIDQQNEYFIFLRQEGFKQYQSANKNFHKVLADYRPYSLKEQLIFPFKLYQFKLDLIHFTHFNAPIFYRRPFVVTIHDLIISSFPDSRATTLPSFLYKIKLFGYQFILKNAVKSARKIIAVSEATKKDIVNLLEINPQKIDVIYEGVDLFPISNFQFPISKQIPNSKFKIPDSYILYVGAAYPHKNLERLLIAFKKFLLSSNHPIAKKLRLVLVGQEDYFYQRLKEIVEKNNLLDRVVFAGRVSDKDLASYYQHALFFIFPSLMEGFGLPALEAISYGTPVAASSVSSLPEILGEAAYYFNPREIKEIEKAIEIIATDDKLRLELKEKGFVQARKFSWQKMAKQILKIYKTTH